MKKTGIFILACIACILLLAAGCTSTSSSATTTTPTATQAPSGTASSGQSWSGNWDTMGSTTIASQSPGALVLTQSGSSVTGTFVNADKGKGTITGTVSGNTLSGTWTVNYASETDSGSYEFVLSDDKNSFTGGWISVSDKRNTLSTTSEFWNGVRTGTQVKVVSVSSPIPAVRYGATWSGCSTVYANNTNWGTINGTNYTNKYFFAIVANSHFNDTRVAYRYHMDSNYTDRYYMEQLRVQSSWLPSSYPVTDYEWDFVSNLTCDAVLYKKGLAGWVDTSDGTYFIWYGNRTNATWGPPRPNGSGMMCPTIENATNLVNLTVIWNG